MELKLKLRSVWLQSHSVILLEGRNVTEAEGVGMVTGWLCGKRERRELRKWRGVQPLQVGGKRRH